MTDKCFNTYAKTVNEARDKVASYIIAAVILSILFYLAVFFKDRQNIISKRLDSKECLHGL